MNYFDNIVLKLFKMKLNRNTRRNNLLFLTEEKNTETDHQV